MTNYNHMKIFIPFLFAAAGLFFITTSQAQNTLIERFGEEAIASIQGSEKLAILEFQNKNGYAVQDLSGLKDISEHPDALEVEPLIEGSPLLTEDAFEQDSFELFAFQFPQPGKRNLYYRIGNTGKALVIYSTTYVKQLYEQLNTEE